MTQATDKRRQARGGLGRTAVKAAGVAVLAALLLGAGPHPSEKQAKLISGIWDFSKRAHAFPLLVVIRQEGNPYPSFWVGQNTGGTLTLTARHDPLSDGVGIESTGGWVGKLTNTARKQGMEKTIPGGVWAADLKAKPLGVEFQKFSAWKVVEPAKPDPDTVNLEARFEGTFTADGRTAAISGTARLAIRARIQSFAFTAECTVTGADLGLGGAQAGPLQVRFWLASPVSSAKPVAPANEIDLD